MELHPGVPQEIQDRMNAYQQSRREKQPLEKRSAGTMFLRPPGHYVGPMIKACGLMGFAVGDAQVSLKHPDFVVNNGHATCEQILAVLHEVQRRVQEKYHVYVPLDVRVLGRSIKYPCK
jgi:UDP-N-acetylmuramate dehydrogenase